MIDPRDCGKPHFFPSSLTNPNPGDVCLKCGIIYCPVAYDHDEDVGYCAACGSEF